MKFILSALTVAALFFYAFYAPSANAQSAEAKAACAHIGRDLVRLTGAARDAAVQRYNQCLRDHSKKK